MLSFTIHNSEEGKSINTSESQTSESNDHLHYRIDENCSEDDLLALSNEYLEVQNDVSKDLTMQKKLIVTFPNTGLLQRAVPVQHEYIVSKRSFSIQRLFTPLVILLIGATIATVLITQKYVFLVLVPIVLIICSFKLQLDGLLVYLHNKECFKYTEKEIEETKDLAAGLLESQKSGIMGHLSIGSKPQSISRREVKAYLSKLYIATNPNPADPELKHYPPIKDLALHQDKKSYHMRLKKHQEANKPNGFMSYIEENYLNSMAELRQINEMLAKISDPEMHKDVCLYRDQKFISQIIRSINNLIIIENDLTAYYFMLYAFPAARKGADVNRDVDTFCKNIKLGIYNIRTSIRLKLYNCIEHTSLSEFPSHDSIGMDHEVKFAIDLLNIFLSFENTMLSFV